MVLGAERSAPEARRASIRRAVYLGSVQNRLTAPELDEAARARLDPFYGIAIVENDPYAPDCAVFEDDAAPVLCPLTVGKRDPRPCSQPNGHGGPCKARERLAPIVAPSVAPEPDPIATADARARGAAGRDAPHLPAVRADVPPRRDGLRLARREPSRLQPKRGIAPRPSVCPYRAPMMATGQLARHSDMTRNDPAAAAQPTTVAAFINRHGIRADARWADDNPNALDMAPGSSHWRVTLRNRAGRQMTVPFSMGPALSHEPTAREVLSCLIDDAASAEYARSFEEWADELGFDPDSRKAERTYRAVERQSAQLRRFLGDAYQDALTVERD
jgi:hypothetical protein